MDAQQQPCLPDGKSTAVAKARRVAGQNWYGAPDVTVLVDKKKGADQCAQECLARANDASSGGCKAFQVSYV